MPKMPSDYVLREKFGSDYKCAQCQVNWPKTLNGGPPGPRSIPTWHIFTPEKLKLVDVVGEETRFCSKGCARKWVDFQLVPAPVKVFVKCKTCNGKGRYPTHPDLLEDHDDIIGEGEIEKEEGL